MRFKGSNSYGHSRAVHIRSSGTRASCIPRVGFIVTNLTRPAERVSKFYNGRGTAEQWIREGKNALRWTRLSCHAFRHNAVRLQLRRPCLQPRQLPALAGLAAGGRAVVAHDLAREAGQDRRPDRAPRAVRGLPARRGGGAAGAVRRDPAPDRPLARTAHGSGLTGADHGAASVEGRTMRRRSGRARRKPVARPVARSRIAHGDRGPAFGGSSVDAQPFEEHRRTRDRRLSGRCRLIAVNSTVPKGTLWAEARQRP